uniref:Uncharacterized protein n=1 Tax=Anguilla anguilla TaxID=7936 RepID=A0A0E9V9C7_ANGAN
MIRTATPGAEGQ